MSGIDLSELMTGEVFQMIARLTPSRNTALGSGSSCNSAFFSPKHPPPQRSESDNIGDWLMQSKKDGKDQESIQSITTPDPGYQWESNSFNKCPDLRNLLLCKTGVGLCISSYKAKYLR